MAKSKLTADVVETDATEIQPTHVVIQPIRHDGTYYPRNALIVLSADAAERLEEMGVAQPIASPATPVTTEAAIEG